LRIGTVLGAIFHPRRTDHAAQAELDAALAERRSQDLMGHSFNYALSYFCRYIDLLVVRIVRLNTSLPLLF